MKKNFKFYAIGWVALLGLFNLLAFITPAWPTLEKYSASFWIGYSFINAAFIGQLACAWVAFKEESLKKTFYNLSLFTVSYAGLVASFAAGLICMVITPLPYWVGAVICPVILVFSLVAVLKAKVAIDLVSGVDKKIAAQTFFIKSLTVDAETLMASAKSDAVKAACRKVSEAIRYSDPMSSDALASAEGQITLKFAELSDAVKADDAEKTEELAKEVVVLVESRNQKCKLLK